MRKILWLLTVSLVIAASAAYVSRNRIRNFFLTTFYPWTVQGKVIDITNGSPLDLAEIHLEGRKTYSIFDGTFKLENVKNLSTVIIVSPDLYEEYKNPLICQKETALSGSQRLAVCNVSLYPTAANTSTRVEINLSVVRPETYEELQNRNGALWDLMDPESRTFLSNRQAFVNAMVIYNTIQRKLSLQQIYFSVEGEKTKTLSKWTNPVSGYVYTDVMEVPVDRTYASGKEVKTSDHFVRVDGIWRYIPEISLSEIKAYNNTYGWALKLKD